MDFHRRSLYVAVAVDIFQPVTENVLHGVHIKSPLKVGDAPARVPRAPLLLLQVTRYKSGSGHRDALPSNLPELPAWIYMSNRECILFKRAVLPFLSHDPLPPG